MELTGAGLIWLVYSFAYELFELVIYHPYELFEHWQKKKTSVGSQIFVFTKISSITLDE
jgi:hypothetical protein